MRGRADFYAREILTWALTQQDRQLTLDRVKHELHSRLPQARSQALHTLSKLREPSAWSAITEEMLQDNDDEVAKAAWRAAVTLVPKDGKAALAKVLATQFGRGGGTGRETQASLSRAFQGLSSSAAAAVHEAQRAKSLLVRVHALATERIMNDPDEGFEAAMYEARLELES